jgi:uracil-DNA glycosylase family protein
VFGVGPETARIALVGEQPGDQEDRIGEPFVGPAGRVLDRALADAGIDRRDAYVTNAVKHFRFELKGKRRIHQTPGPEHLQACRPWLEAEFTVLRPEIVVCLGATAARTLISPSFRITKDRGHLIPWTPPSADVVVNDGEEADDDEPDEGAPAQTWKLATTHPSAILRTPDDARPAAYDALVADLAVVAHALA